MTLLRIDKASNPIDPFLEWLSAGEREVFNEETFKRMIAIERKRTERSREPFLLMLLGGGKREGSERNETVLDRVLSVLLLSIRETDVIGWYKDRTTVGVMFTGLARHDKNTILSVILSKVSTTAKGPAVSRPIQASQYLLPFLSG